MRKNEIQGYIYILIATTLWGVSSVVAKSLFNTGLPPAELVLIRLTLATLTILFILLAFDRKRMTISFGDLPFFLILGLVGVAGVQITYYLSISKIQIGPAVLIQYLSPVWISLYAFLSHRETVSMGKIASLVLSVTGCYFVVGGYQFDLLRLNRIGIASGLVSSLFFAFYSIYGETGLRRYDPWTITLYSFGFAALPYCVFISPMKIINDGHSIQTWMAFLYIAIFSTLVPFALYFKGIDRLRATRASITATWEPVVASSAAYLVLGEVLHPLQILGGLGVIAAVILLQIVREISAPLSSLEIRQDGEIKR